MAEEIYQAPPRMPGQIIVARVIWFIAGVIEALLVIRIILRLLAAAPTAGFTNFIYSITQPLVDPFAGIVRSTATAGTGGIFEWTTLIALIVYWLIAWAIISLTQISRPVPRY
ncbi:MAG: YggT family protein [Candidatus Doudnabacteria bacterium]|nr:YggT family protein [Candidatus Doudnabacteria bacterium]